MRRADGQRQLCPGWRVHENRDPACKRGRRPGGGKRLACAVGAGSARGIAAPSRKSGPQQLQGARWRVNRSGYMKHHSRKWMLLASAFILTAGSARAADVTLTIESWRNDDLPVWQEKII